MLSQPFSFYAPKICIVKQCCSLELSLGRQQKILIDVLAFLSNGNGLYARVWDKQKMSVIWAGGFSVVSLPGSSSLS